MQLLRQIGHFSRVCRRRLSNRQTQGPNSSSIAAAICESNLTTISSSAASNLTQVLCDVTLQHGVSAKFLMDAGSPDCYIDKWFAERHSSENSPALGEVTFVDTSVRMPIRGQCAAALNVNYSDVVFNVVNNLATNVTIGKNFSSSVKKWYLVLKAIVSR